jgi:recombination protein RecR
VDYPAPVARLIDELRRLPGIGPKSAQRVAFHLLKTPRDEAQRLATAVGELHDAIRTCSLCNAITDQPVCATCSDPQRSERSICVVEEPHNLLAVERTRDFRGRYHVLHGVLSPLAGIGPDELRIHGLVERLRGGQVEEVILAPCSNRWACASRASPWACRLAPTSSGPTRSPWPRPSRVAASTEAPRQPAENHALGPDGLPCKAGFRRAKIATLRPGSSRAGQDCHA